MTALERYKALRMDLHHARAMEDSAKIESIEAEMRRVYDRLSFTEKLMLTMLGFG